MPSAPQGKIILVRHGETEANRLRCFAESDDVPLTDLGRAQAIELAARLARQFRPQALFSSEFARARQTGRIVGQALGMTAETIAGIHERNFGCLRGQRYSRMGEAMLADPQYDPGRAWLWAPAGGESLDDVRRRAMAALDAIRHGRAGQEVLLVSHGAVIQAVCAHITGEWSESFVPPNCGVMEIDWNAEGWLPPVLSDEWEGLAR